MKRRPILFFINKLNKPAFTTGELAAVSGKSSSAVTQALNYLCEQGIIFKVYRGLWAQAYDKSISPYAVISYLFPKHRAYVSFISALRFYGIVEQVPQIITLASTAHTKKINTKIGVFSVHHIGANFFKGFDWYKETGSFLIAQQEKALVDCLYISSCKKRQFRHFPELHFPKTFSFSKARKWAESITDAKNRQNVQNRLEEIINANPISKKRFNKR